MVSPTYNTGFYAPGRGTPKYPELWRGCVGAWNPGLGPTGLTLRDWSGKGNHGTLTNGPTWGVGGGSQALSFDGVDDYCAFEKIPDVPISVSCWFNSNSNSAIQTLFSLGNTGSSTPYVILRLRGDVALDPVEAVMLTNSNDNIIAQSIDSYITGLWMHVCAVFRSRTLVEIYVNGKLNATATGPAGSEVFNSMVIGCLRRTNTVHFFSGELNEIRVDNRALSLTEIQLLATHHGIAYELAQRKTYSLPSSPSSRQYKLLRASILRGA